MAMFGNQGFKDWQNVDAGAYMPKPDLAPVPSTEPTAPQKMPAWKAALGGLFDSILSQTGGQPVFVPQMMLNKQREYEDAQFQRRQGEELQRQLALKQFDLDHPAPVNNDTVNDYQFIMQRLGQPAADQYLRNLGDPTVTVPLGPNRIYTGPRSGLGTAIGGGGGYSGPTPGTVEGGYRFKGGNPADQNNWEPAGGPSQPATGGFRY